MHEKVTKPKIIIDLDDTITIDEPGIDYAEKKPDLDVIQTLRRYRLSGFEIVINTARSMRTYEGAVGKITAKSVPVILEWLNRYDVPYDELIVGKPWCGPGGFYVDDKSVRPSEFKTLSYEEIVCLVGQRAPE